MNAHDDIKVTSSEEKFSTIIVTGAPTNVVEAKKALEVRVRVKDLKGEKANKDLKSFEIKLEVWNEIRFSEAKHLNKYLFKNKV
jgi:hypothetical protein